MTFCAALGALGCAAPDPGSTEDDGSNGTLRGEIRRAIEDHEDGTSETAYFAQGRDGREWRLIFERDPGLESDARVALWGRRAGEVFVVSNFAIDAEPPATTPRRGALTAVTPVPARTFAFVLVDTGGGVNITANAARQVLFDANFFMPGRGSVRRYYREQSYGIQDITGDVFGPLSYAPTSSCDTAVVSATLRAQVDQLAGGRSDHYLWYFGSRQSGCGFAGAAALGSPARPQQDSWYNASSGCSVLVQEPGHNLGLQHSSSMVCPGNQPFVDAPDRTCTHNEYGDLFDTMGSGCRQMNGWQKSFQGWLQGCNSVKVTASGTFNLFPLEAACDGVQLLQISMPKTRPFSHSGGGSGAMVDSDLLTSYYVELRAPIGFDQGLAPMVLVHVAGDRGDPFASGLHTWLLDMTPGTPTFADAALPVGQSFKDPAGGLTISVLSASATQASIKVEVSNPSNGGGPPTCLDGTTLIAPGPTSCSAAVTGTGGAGGDRGDGDNPSDGGRGGAGGSGLAPGDAASPGDGADDTAGDLSGAVAPPGGCACRLAPSAPDAGPAALLAAPALAAAALLTRRRRRR